MNPVNQLTVLMFGMGQDSTTLLYKYIYDPAFRARYAPGKFIVIASDTGDEHRETYEHAEQVRKLCFKHQIEYHFITKDLGYHGTWGDLRSFYRRTNTVGSKAFKKTCTDNLKLKPIYRFLETYLTGVYDLPAIFSYPTGRKRAFSEFTKKYGNINILIGFAAGEERRKADPLKNPKWMRENLTMVYPLIELSMDRKACHKYIESVGHTIPFPSNCVLCPFLNDIELLYMYRFLFDDLTDWIDIEQNKINANTHKENNVGVWGNKKLLPEKLKEVIEKYGHMTDEQLIEYKMSHGHCVTQKY